MPCCAYKYRETANDGGWITDWIYTFERHNIRNTFNQMFDSVKEKWMVSYIYILEKRTERALRLIFDNRHSSGFSYLLNSGSIFSCLFRLLILFASATLKNWGATSTSHLGSTAVTLWQYSRVVNTNSWYTSHSGFRLKRAEEGWM